MDNGFLVGTTFATYLPDARVLSHECLAEASPPPVCQSGCVDFWWMKLFLEPAQLVDLVRLTAKCLRPDHELPDCIQCEC